MELHMHLACALVLNFFDVEVLHNTRFAAEDHRCATDGGQEPEDLPDDEPHIGLKPVGLATSRDSEAGPTIFRKPGLKK